MVNRGMPAIAARAQAPQAQEERYRHRQVPASPALVREVKPAVDQ